jgi:inward rectifier potassium channel
MVAAFESFAGWLAFALISGLLYGRFSRPSAKIVFSPNLLVAPYKDSQGLMLRMGNARKSELIETEVRIILAMNQPDNEGSVIRRFFPLSLEIDKISFFSLSWTVVHQLTENSPLQGFSPQELIDANAEFLIFVKGIDEVNQQTVHTRRSYIADEVVWNARFQPVISRNSRGLPHVLNRQIGAYESLPEPLKEFQ